MGETKRKMGAGVRILTVLAVMIAFCLPVYAGVQEAEGEYEIYPTPQNIEYGSASMALTEKVTVNFGEEIDSYTKMRVGDTLNVLGLEQVSAGRSNTQLKVGVYGSGDEADKYGKSHGVDANIYGRFDAYTLWIEKGEIVVLGRDTDAAYRGVTTLQRIFEQLKSKSVKELMLKDYAEIESRGFIEGYYGNPWSHEDRVDLMKFGGEIKMNQYVYAPKDDPMHNSQWRTLYDEEGLKKVTELAKAGNESKCFFVYALHPFMNNPLTAANYDRDLEVLKAKFAQVIEAGVRQIAILEDDASANGRWTGDTLVNLLNDVTAWLVSLKETKYPDLKTQLLFCPGWMAYADNMSGNGDDVQKIQTIHAGVGDNVRIVMTGGKIWGDVTTAFADRFYNKVAERKEPGRYPYLWVNWPCNDNTKDSLVMGGHNEILRTNLDGTKYHGIILNPMQDSEPSKVGIFTAADFTWKIWKDTAEGDQAWDDAFKYIDHMSAIQTKSSDSLREIAKHMITQSPVQADRQGEFDESVEIKDALTAFKNKMQAGSLAVNDVKEMRQIFKTIDDAITYYLEEGTNRRMASQLTLYANSLRDVVRADLSLMDALEAILTEDKSTVYEGFSTAQASYDRSKTYGFNYVGTTQYAQGGRKHIKPFTEAVIEYVSDVVKEIVNPGDGDEEQPTKYDATLSYTEGWKVHQGPEGNLIDGNDATFVWFDPTTDATNYKDISLVGDYIQLDLGSAKPVGNVRALVGTSGKGDKWTGYHLEYSEDGDSWTSLDSHTGAQSGVDTYEVDLGGASARYIKLVNDVQVHKWVIFSEFSVYSPSAKNGPVYTNTEDEGWEADLGVDSFELAPREDAVLNQGEYVGLKLDRIHDITDITVTGAGTENLILEKSMNAKEWTQEKKGAARYIRLVNKGTQSVSFRLDSFVVSSKEFLPIDFLSSNIQNGSPTEDARSIKTTRNWVDGDLNSAAKYTSAPTAGSYIIYDLGQEVDIRSIKVWTKVGTYDYPRNAKFQASLTADNDNGWQDILVIDGDAGEGTFSTSPEQNGWTPGEGAVEVAYAYREAKDITPVKARYLRLYFSGANGGRWVELYEVELNDGEYIPPINDPTFETNFDLQKSIVPQNLNDSDLTTAFYPEGVTNGSLIYHLSDEKNIGRINILQSGANISNAKVSIRTGTDTWEPIGTLDESYSAFYTADLENVYDIKIEWTDVPPMIYEIITLSDPGDVLESNIKNAQRLVSRADAELKEAEDILGGIAEQVSAAEAKVNAAANKIEKLRAEVELQNLYASRSAAEVVVAEKKAASASCGAKLAKAEAKKLRVEGSVQEADKKDQEAINKLEEAGQQIQAAEDKKKEQASFEQAAKDKQEELDDALENPDPGPVNPDPVNPDPVNPAPSNPVPAPQPSIKNFKSKTLKFEVLNAAKKTVAVTGPVKKNATSIVIPATVKYGNINWNVVQIKNGAFKGMSKLTKVTIGSKVTKIGKDAFKQCRKLKTVNMKKASKITSIGKNAFSKIDAKAKVTVPSAKMKKYKNYFKKAGLPKTATVKK